MFTIIACSIAFFSTSSFIALWFFVVRKELKIKHKMLDGAKSQLVASRTQCLSARDALETEKAQEIFQRSLDIYKQSVELYNDALQKPWNIIPAILLGFNPVDGDKR